MADQGIVQVTVKDGVGTVTLNRPDIRNAFDDRLIAELTACFGRFSKDASVRVIVLTGAGKAFCAGADLNWMKAMVNFSKEENVRDSMAMARMFRAIDECPKPVIGRINGAAIGGGAGLVAVCDIAVAREDAVFAWSEVKLGLVPAVISPYVLARIGPAKAREYFLTGERFNAQRAREIGLIDHLAKDDAAMDALITEKVKALMTSGPEAVAVAKDLIRMVRTLPDDQVAQRTADIIAGLRVGKEGQEGMRSFLEKRSPSWAPKKD